MNSLVIIIANICWALTRWQALNIYYLFNNLLLLHDNYRQCYYAHVSDEETEVLRAQLTWLVSEKSASKARMPAPV